MAAHVHSEKCKEVFALLSDYLNLELPPEACAEIEGHLGGCRALHRICREPSQDRGAMPPLSPGGIAGAHRHQARDRLVQAYQKMLAARTPWIDHVVTGDGPNRVR